MGMKLYDFTLKVLNLAIPEFKKEGYSNKDIQEGFDLAKRILNRLVSKKDAKDALNKAIDDAKAGKLNKSRGEADEKPEEEQS